MHLCPASWKILLISKKVPLITLENIQLQLLLALYYFIIVNVCVCRQGLIVAVHLSKFTFVIIDQLTVFTGFLKQILFLNKQKSAFFSLSLLIVFVDHCKTNGAAGPSSVRQPP